MAVADMDLSAITADAESNLERLRADAVRLAPEALVDVDVRAELDDVEAQIASCERELERVETARGELGRRASEAEAQSQLEARQAAQERAKTIDGERLKAASAVDGSLRKAAHAIRDLVSLTRDLDAELSAAGRTRAGVPQARVLRAALHHAFREAGVDAAKLLDLEREQPRLLSEVLRPLKLDGAPAGPVRTGETAARRAEAQARVREEAARKTPSQRRQEHNLATSPAEEWLSLRKAGLSLNAAAEQLEHAYQRQAIGPLADPWLVEQMTKGETQYMEFTEKETN